VISGTPRAHPHREFGGDAPAGVDASAPAARGHGLRQPGAEAAADVIDEALRSRGDGRPRDVSLTRGGRELHLNVMATRSGAGRRSDGVVIVLDDMDAAHQGAEGGRVARGGAPPRARNQEPLTPIQLSAERMRRHLASAPEPTHSSSRNARGPSSPR